MELILILYLYVRPFIVGIALLAGLITLLCKIKSTKVLGLGIVLSSASSILDCIGQIIAKTSTAESAYEFNTSVGIIQFFLLIGSTLCLCFFIHKNYGKKLIYLPLLLIPIAVAILTLVVARSLGNVLSGSELGIWTSISTLIISCICGIITALIVIHAFFTNRDDEEVIPKAWLCKVIELVWNVIETVLIVSLYLTLLKDGVMTTEQVDSSFMLIVSMRTLFALVFPVYLMIKAITSSVGSTD